MSSRRLRCIGLLTAQLVLCGCATEVRLAPARPEWSAGRERAVWRAEGVEVAADLVAEVGERPVHGTIHSHLAGTAVSFTAPRAVAGERIGEVRVGGTAEPILAGTWYAIPTGAQDGAAFDLRPDLPWPDPPAVGSTVTYAIAVRSGERTVLCPFEFLVESTSSGLSSDAETIAPLVLIPLLVAVLIWAGHESWEDFDMSFSFTGP